MKYKYLLFTIFTLFFVVNPLYAATYTFNQTLYGTGVTSVLDIDYYYLNQTGGAYGHLYRVTASPTQGTYNFLTPVSTQNGVFNLGLFPLLPNEDYILIKDTSSNGNAATGNSHIGQVSNADNISTAYPYPTAGFYGFVYFQTDFARRIKCYDTDIGATGPLENFRDCENSVELQTTVSTTTTIVIDSEPLVAAIATSSEKTAVSMSVLAFAIMFTGLLSALILFKRK